MADEKYDLIVIGSGGGHSVAYAAAHRKNWKVALIEKGPLGGTCLNRGCIPSKILIHSADVLEKIKRSEDYGIKTEIKDVNFKRIIERSTKYVDEISKNVEETTENDTKIDLYRSEGRFVDEHTVEIAGKGKRIKGKKILVAAGARPLIPDLKGLDEIDYITSTEALRLKKLPKSMIIVGGGYIGAELGHFYGSLGTEITVVEHSKYLIDKEDWEVAKTFTEEFGKKYKLYLESSAEEFKKNKNGLADVKIVSKNGKKKTITAEAVLISVGIRPNSDLADIKKAGVKTDKKGFIKVNSYMRTNKKHIWALGDVVGRYPFRHTANWEAGHVNVNFFSKNKSRVDYSALPHAVFSSPQVAGVGMTEQEAKSKKISYHVEKKHYKDTGMGKALEQETGFCKFILRKKDNKILGCYIIGPHASILIHEVVIAMKSCNGKSSAITDAIHIHPSLSEVVYRAL
jgi:dihydrolipoamide dehydrogenase